ncbi:MULTISPECIES: PA14 domain-containing protein [unclassified Microcoleus]|uniref:PA14 domain-containing protein n=1 Tax=unclassified Microcoleus TaxID=2642155 RepID=UPI002FCFD0BC
MSGLKGYYFNNTTLQKPSAHLRTDPKIGFSWLKEPAPTVNPDGFSVRWKGMLNPPVDGDYTFCTSSDDGVRLWVDDQLIIDNWNSHSLTTDVSKPVKLSEGAKYPITLEFYDQTGRAVIDLFWSYPGQDEDLIPSEAFTATKNYKVSVVTANQPNPGAETNANVYLTLNGTLGVSAENYLEGSFPTGSTRDFDIDSTDLGNLESVHVRHDNSNEAPAWLLDKVTVKDEETGQEWVFSCGKWIANNEQVDPEKKLGRTLRPGDSSEPKGLRNGQIIGLKADNGVYLARTNSLKQAVVARVPAANLINDPSTHFEVVKLDGNKVALKADNGLFVAYQEDQAGTPPYRSAVAKLSTVTQAAQFEVIVLDGNKIALKAVNELYLARTQRLDEFNDVLVARVRESSYASEPKAQFEVTVIK